ncbi:Lipoyl synthase [Candidatus Magnetaquicoccaceae bacterium FCR-1]|uniref:Lipoyl synthase n=1 Tax=Candidatus Magnetaquiglobus chichijimensis TaxID=3141448 RepID=A0ABQ0C9I9_9PROT
MISCDVSDPEARVSGVSPEPSGGGAIPARGKPRWLKVLAPGSEGYRRMRALTGTLRLETVCQSARCPNIGDCWQAGSAAFMILGVLCTRSCGFCDVKTGRPAPPDPDEPRRLAEAVTALALRHAVITSVTRDDLEDGGAGQFVACVEAIRARSPGTTVELLIPDFRGAPIPLEAVLNACPEVLNHNVETVPRLYPRVRPAASYAGSLQLLARAASHAGAGRVKSGIMLGLGEEEAEIEAVLVDLRRVGVDLLTIGQYLAPSRDHLPVVRYWEPEVFEGWRKRALEMGFAAVESHPLARSSMHAERLLGINDHD